MFLVSDDYGDFAEIKNYKQLRELLIDEIIDEAVENVDEAKNDNDEKDIVVSNIKQLGKLAKNDRYDAEYVMKELNSFGWYVENICDIQRSINNLREFYARKHSDLSAFDKILDLLDKGL